MLTDATCFDATDASIDITITGGSLPLDFNWNPGGITTEDLTGVGAGTYTVAIGDTFGCNNTYSFTITEPAEVLLSAVTDAADCFGDETGSIDVTTTNAIGTPTYVWSNSETTEDITGVGAGSYTVVVTDANGCTQTLSTNVGEAPELIVDNDGTNLLCFNDESGAIDIIVNGGTPGIPAYNYDWESNDPSFDPGDVQDIDDLPAGEYGVTVTDANGCTATSGTVVISQPEDLEVTASDDETIAIGFGIEISADAVGGTGFIDYEWSPVDGLDDANEQITNAAPQITTDYVVTATDDNGCAKTDTVTITVDFNLVTIPDAFTPNGDGLNDIFEVLASTAIDVIELKVFNRWGKLISEDPTGWDGTVDGTLQPMDTYVYQAVIVMPDGERVPYTGDFILIR